MSRLIASARVTVLNLQRDARGALRDGCMVAAMLAEGRDVYARSWDSPGDAMGGEDELSDITARLDRIEEATEGGFDRQRAKRLGLVPESVLAERRKTARVYGAQDQRGWLGVYQRTVAPVHEGAVLKGQ